MNKNNIYKNSLVAKNEDDKTIYIGTLENRCFCCGEIIPEGIEVCKKCEFTMGR